MKKTSVLIVDQNRLFAEALSVIVASDAAFTIAGSDESGVDALRSICSTKPGLVVAGQSLPDMNMAQVIREIRRVARSVGFLFIISESSPELLRLLGETERIGAVPASAGLGEFMEALRSVARGERYVSREVIENYSRAADDTVAADPLELLTPREREVLYWLAHGCANAEISAKMVLSEKTVKNHVSHILRKLAFTDRTKAAALAWREGLPLIPEEFFSLQ